MGQGIIGISASFLVLIALILWMIIISKGGMWTIKSIVIFIAALFTIIVFLSLKNFIGWPSTSKLPEEFQLHWAIIHEPNKLERKEGYIYMWTTELSVNGKNSGIPRAYKSKYTRKNHEQVAAALLRLGDGILQKGEKVEAKEDIDTEEDFAIADKILSNKLSRAKI